MAFWVVFVEWNFGELLNGEKATQIMLVEDNTADVQLIMLFLLKFKDPKEIR